MSTDPTSSAPHVLREYALLADGERGALVGPRGDLVWMCAPQWHSPAVFSALLGGTGNYTVRPANPRFVWGGSYEERSLIWRSRWVTEDGVVECREALAFPGDPRRLILLRRVVGIDYAATVDVTLEPAGEFGAVPLTDIHHRSGVWTGRMNDLRMRWSGADDARRRHGRLDMQLTVRPGEQRDLVLELTEHDFDGPPPDADEMWHSTESAWRASVPELHDTVAATDAQLAYAVMRGLTSSGGGMVAAATTALPERAEQGRSYDYRYVWIRDQCFAGQAAAVTEPRPLLDDAVRFVAERLLTDGPRTAPAYTVDGGPVPNESHVPGLRGYPGGGNQVGNHVNSQFQLDAFGESLLLFAAAADRDRLSSDHWRAAEVAAKTVEKRWQEPNAGIWEIDNERWTHSRLICIAGLRAIARHASTAQAGRWVSLADSMLAATSADSLHPSGRWQRSPSDDKVDAALLLAAIRGAVPAEDPRTIATLQAVRQDLVQDHFVYRFRQAPGPLGRAEGAFLMCGFAMALAEHQQGRETEAFRYFERNRTACGPPGLISEEYDVQQRQLRGNLPQAFVHGMLLEAAARLRHPPKYVSAPSGPRGSGRH